MENENPFEPTETIAEQNLRVGRMIRENIDKRVEVIIPISRFRRAFDIGDMAVDVLQQEVAGRVVRLCIDERCFSDDVERFLRWCVEKAQAKQSVYDPFNPHGQFVCGNPMPARSLRARI